MNGKEHWRADPARGIVMTVLMVVRVLLENTHWNQTKAWELEKGLPKEMT